MNDAIVQQHNKAGKQSISYNNFPNLTYVLFSTIILPANAEKRFTVAFTRVCSSFSMGKRKQKSYISQKIVDIVLCAKEYW